MKSLDPVLLLLFGGMCLFTFVLLAVTKFFSEDGQIFQVISGLVMGFAGAFFGRIKPSAQPDVEKKPTDAVPTLPTPTPTPLAAAAPLPRPA
jgi:hypothetical protein